jgi:hypothetical protein
MREVLIRYLNTHDGNALVQFLDQWIAEKVPSRSVAERHTFIQTYVQHLLHAPVMFDTRYSDALNQLIDTAKVELEICSIVKSNDYKHVIFYY